MLEAYLREMERELVRSLPAEDVAGRLAEIEAHLRDGIEGRIELGLEPPAAVREAIEAFGPSRQVARSMGRQGTGAAARMAILGSGYGLGILFFEFGARYLDLYPASMEWLFAAWLGLGFAFAVAAFCARRPAPLRVAATGVAGALAVWLSLGMTWLCPGIYGGRGLIEPGGAERYVRQERRALEARQAGRATFEEAMRVLQGPRGVEGLRTPAGYSAPVTKASWGYDEPLALTTLPDAQGAIRAWNDLRQRGRWRFETGEQEADLAAVLQAQAAPAYRNLLYLAPQILPGCLGVALLAVALDLGFGSLGAYVRSPRRRRRSGGLRA